MDSTDRGLSEPASTVLCGHGRRARSARRRPSPQRVPLAETPAEERGSRSAGRRRRARLGPSRVPWRAERRRRFPGAGRSARHDVIASRSMEAVRRHGAPALRGRARPRGPHTLRPLAGVTSRQHHQHLTSDPRRPPAIADEAKRSLPPTRDQQRSGPPCSAPPWRAWRFGFARAPAAEEAAVRPRDRCTLARAQRAIRAIDGRPVRRLDRQPRWHRG